MNALQFACAAFTVYAATGLVAASHLFKPFRREFRRTAWMLPFVLACHFVKWEQLPLGQKFPIIDDVEDLDLSTERDIQGYDFIACRMCVGVWVTAGLFAWNTPAQWLLGIYGAAYFLATQERE